MPFLRQFLQSPGEWRMLATKANGQPAAAAYHRGQNGSYEAFAIVVLTPAAGGIARITLFDDTLLFGRFDLPATQSAAGARAHRMGRPPWEHESRPARKFLL
jgi:RNA polymerase sigma-70 factor (ECF subfamily)